MDTRYEHALQWVQTIDHLSKATLSPASADASFRRYFRVDGTLGSYILMDAPPDKEDSSAFISIAKALSKLDVHAPEVFEADLAKGFLLIEDLGNRTYLDELNNNADALYTAALEALLKIQSGANSDQPLRLNDYDATRLQDEMNLFEQWFVKRHLDIELDFKALEILHKTQAFLIDACLTQPQVWVHRDYHSRNLMITEERSPGVIDFQDMVTGPIAYDLASLFKDCYIAWPRSQQLNWLNKYYQLAQQGAGIAAFSFDDLIRWYDLTGMQRHLKVLGIFCRLHYRDGKDHYLNDLPLVAHYILEVLDLYPELATFDAQFRPIIMRAIS